MRKALTAIFIGLLILGVFHLSQMQMAGQAVMSHGGMTHAAAPAPCPLGFICPASFEKPLYAALASGWQRSWDSTVVLPTAFASLALLIAVFALRKTLFAPLFATANAGPGILRSTFKKE